MKHILLVLAFICQPAFAFSSFDTISLIFKGIQFLHTESVPKEIVITETGMGSTQTEAVENALQLAISKGIGVLIVSDQTVNGDQVVRNLIASYSSGVINSYEIRSCNQGNFIVCEVTAKVSPWKFMQRLQGDSQTILVNGNDLYMQHRSAQATMIQRRKLAEYYFSQIRNVGLDAKIREVKILPSNGRAKIAIDYEVKWNPDYKKSMIAFLEKLEKDTKGETNQEVYIQWGPTGFFENRVRINTQDPYLRQMMLNYLFAPIEVNIVELGICERFDPPEDVFKIDWYGFRKQKVIEIDSQKLMGIRKLSASTSCK
jgi:hypothetical protein